LSSTSRSRSASHANPIEADTLIRNRMPREFRGIDMNSNARGSALLAVLWMSAALSAIAISIGTTVRTEADHAANVSDGLRVSYLASGSIDRAIQWMVWGDSPHSTEPSLPSWDRMKSRLRMSYSSGDVVVEVIPEAAKLNVNDASEDDLMRVVTVISGDPA